MHFKPHPNATVLDFFTGCHYYAEVFELTQRKILIDDVVPLQNSYCVLVSTIIAMQQYLKVVGTWKNCSIPFLILKVNPSGQVPTNWTSLNLSLKEADLPALGSPGLSPPPFQVPSRQRGRPAGQQEARESSGRAREKDPQSSNGEGARGDGKQHHILY